MLVNRENLFDPKKKCLVLANTSIRVNVLVDTLGSRGVWTGVVLAGLISIIVDVE